MAPDGDVTRLLQRMSEGDAAAPRELLPLVYAELHRLARRQMAAERSAHTLQATALIHEAFLRLADSPQPQWECRGHFLRVAARAMRNILVDHARSRRTLKAGGDRERVLLDEALSELESRSIDVLAVHDALERLSELDPELEQVVEMHFFGGLTFQEIAAALGVTERTIYRRWCLARAWLRGEMEEG